MKEHDLNQKIEETLNSIDGISPTDPGDFFAAKTIAKMQNRQSAKNDFLLVLKLALVVLVTVNLGSIVVHNREEALPAEDAITQLSEEYFGEEYKSYEIDLAL